MILPVIGELGELSRVPKLDQAQRERVYGLMTELREYGFTIHELFVLFRGKVSVISIKRNTRGGKVKDTSEHDRILEQLTLFAERGGELGELEEYRRDRETVEAAGLSFESCATLSRNLLQLGLDASGLVRLSGELADEGLTAKSIRGSIDLNERLGKKRITPEIQEEILNAAEKYGDPVNILGLVNAVGGITKANVEKFKVEEYLKAARAERDGVLLEKERLELENAAFRSYVDVAKLLVTKHGFDMRSLGELLELAGKHGDAPHTVGAVNMYNRLLEIQAAHREAEARLKVTEDTLAVKGAELKVREEGLAKANQWLGEIKANHAQSIRLQILSDLITGPREVKASIDELARICLSVLMGVRDVAQSRRDEADRFNRKTGMRLNWMIQDLQEYLR
jgi:hypothetical protein